MLQKTKLALECYQITNIKLFYLFIFHPTNLQIRISYHFFMVICEAYNILDFSLFQFFLKNVFVRAIFFCILLCSVKVPAVD